MPLWIMFAPFLTAGDAAAAAAAIISYGAQWLKAQKKIPTYFVQGGLIGVGFAFYVASHPLTGEGNWLRDGFMWACALPGIASVSASASLAPKTDTK